MTSYSPAVPFKIVLQKTADYRKVSGLSLFGKSGAGKTTTLLAASSILEWLPGLPVDPVEQLQALSNVLQRPLESLTSFLCSGYVVAQMEQRRLPGQEGASGRLGLRASRCRTYSAEWSPSMSSGLCDCASKRKTRLIALLTQIA